MAQMASPGSPLPGGYILGRLSHADRVGLVYRAQSAPDRAADTDVHSAASAIVLHPLHLDELREWFENMAVLGRSLRHPNLVEVLAIGYTHNDLPVVVTECTEGRTVRNELLSGRDFSISDALHIVRSVADALDYLHGRTPPVLHRVIMPETVLLANAGTVKLLAVGHADRPYHPAAKVSALSPEEFSREYPLSPVSDVFSLASFAFELITSRAAFPGNAHGLVATVFRGGLPRVTLTGIESATDLDAVLHRAWSRDPALRHPSAGDLATDLAHALESLPAGVRPARRQLRNHDGRVSTLPAPSFGTPVALSISPVVFPHQGALRGNTPSSYPPPGRPLSSRPPPGLVPAMAPGSIGFPRPATITDARHLPVGLAPLPAALAHAVPWATAPARVSHPGPIPPSPTEPDVVLSPEPTEISDPEVLAALAVESTHPVQQRTEVVALSVPVHVDPVVLAPSGAPSLPTPARLKDTMLPQSAEAFVAEGNRQAHGPVPVPVADVSPARTREIKLTLPVLMAFVVLNAVLTAALVYAALTLGPGASAHGSSAVPHWGRPRTAVDPPPGRDSFRPLPP